LKYLVGILVFLFLTAVELQAQNITAQGTVTLTTAVQTSAPIDIRNTGTSSISFTWSTTPPITAGICQMQQATVNTGPWTNFGTPFTATASGGPLTAAMVVNFLRFTCPTPLAGTGSVGVRYVGTMAPATTGTGSDVNVTNPSLVVSQPVAGNLNATIVGTVTANAGTGFGVAQGSTTAGQVGSLFQCAVTTAAPAYTNGQTSPCSLDPTGGLRVSGLTGGGGLTQGSATGGQLGTLVQAAATTAAPTYTTGTTNPLSMDLTGALRVNVVATVGGGAGGGTSSNFAAAFPAAGTAAGFSDGTNMQGARVYDVNTGAGIEYVAGVNLRVSGAAGSVEGGVAANPLRIDPTGTTIQPVSGTITAVPGVGNFTVVQPTAANLNATVTGTVTANAGTGFAGVAQGSTTAGQTGNLTMAAVTTTAPTYTNGQTSPFSLDTSGALRVNTGTGTSNTVNMQAGATGTGNGTVLPVDGMAVAHLTAICTVTCGTPAVITLSAQNDGTNFITVYGTQDGTNTISSAFNVAGTTAVGISVQLHGEKQLRAAITTYGGGTINVVGTASPAAGNPPPVVNANIVTSPLITNVNQWGANPIDTNTGNATAGTLRVVLATSQPNLGTALNVAVTGTPTFNLTGINGGTPATSATGVLRVAIADTNNTAILATADPCAGSATTNFNVSFASATAQVLVTATAAQNVYICSIHVHGNTTTDEIVSILEGIQTTNPCDTTNTVLDGTNAIGTPANGLRIPAGGGGYTLARYGTIYKTAAVNHQVCALAAGTNRLSVSGTYVKAP